MTLSLDRRTLLVTGCAGCAAVVAGCGSSSKATPAAAAGTSTGTSSTGASSPVAPSPAATSAAALATLSSLTAGTPVSAQADGKAVIVVRTGATTAVAFSARCPHMGCTVAPDGAQLACPCHGSRFAADGSLVNGPAPRGLTPFPVKVVGDAVLPG